MYDVKREFCYTRTIRRRSPLGSARTNSSKYTHTAPTSVFVHADRFSARSQPNVRTGINFFRRNYFVSSLRRRHSFACAARDRKRERVSNRSHAISSAEYRTWLLPFYRAEISLADFRVWRAPRRFDFSPRHLATPTAMTVRNLMIFPDPRLLRRIYTTRRTAVVTVASTRRTVSTFVCRRGEFLWEPIMREKKNVLALW